MRWQVLLRCAMGAVTMPLMGGCASLNQWSADVATYGDWPADRRGGSFAFDLLPSQQVQAEGTAVLEAAARPALLRAGFTPVTDGAEPELLVQLAARVGPSTAWPWPDPFWWPGGYGGGYWGGPWGGPWGGYWGGYWGPYRGRWGGPYWGGPYGGVAWAYPSPRYTHEVAVLIRDRASGRPLYEAHASTDAFNYQLQPLLQPLFGAALADFPARGVNPRQVTVTVDEAP